MGGTGHALSSCLLGCGIGVWLGTSGVAAPMSCTSQSAFCCISHSFASGGKSVTPPTNHGSMSRLRFGLTKAIRPPRKMRQRMRRKCVCCVANGAPPSQFVMSVRSNISLGRSGICQHGAFSGIAVSVASFVPAECPKGGGMWGIFGKPLKRAFRRCMG